jgi:hypothetical protein
MRIETYLAGLGLIALVLAAYVLIETATRIQ